MAIYLDPVVVPSIGSTSRSSISSSSSLSNLLCGCDVKPRPIRLNRVTKYGILVLSKLASQLKAGGKRSWRAVARAGHLKSRCSAVRSPPHLTLHLSGGFPG